jgi:2-dehydro-3-deoxyphosphogluconate aldolase/(4S)-4-hydroxy-2-oxoglutarate aldolase
MRLSRAQITQKISAHRLVAIVRLPEQQLVAATLACLVEGGVEVLEITANTPGYCEEITQARQKYANVLIGAGTIINLQRAKQAVAAGAQFLVTPNTNAEVVEFAHANDIPVLMGALTPTEIALAIEMQADMIKLFPAGELGLKYFKGIQGPFSDTPFFPVGGIGQHNVSDWFKQGAAGVGVGNQLTRAINSEQERIEHIAYVKQFMATVRSATN